MTESALQHEIAALKSDIAKLKEDLKLAGQVGADKEGNIANTPAQQHRLAWENVLAILKAAGMDRTNIVDVHVYITDRSQTHLFRQVRDEVLGDHLAASTLLIVAGLADPKLLVEISVVAAAAS